MSEAWNSGYVAQGLGVAVDECPYEPNTSMYEQWTDGWNTALQDQGEQE